MMDQLMTEKTFRKYEKYFWCAYILLPLFTGFLRYNWLPNESFDERIHYAISSYSADTNPVGGSTDVVDKWESKTTGKAFTKKQFATHRHHEAVRIGILSFIYALIGCVYYSYGQVIKKLEPSIPAALKSSIIYALLASAFFIFLSW